MKRKFIIGIAGALAVAGATAFGATSLVQASENNPVQLADGHKAAAVKERQQTMKEVGANMKVLAGFVKDSKGTAAEAEAAANKIGALAKTIPAVFKVEATLDEMDAVGKNRSKPEIWMNWDGFVKRAGVLEQESVKLAGVIKGGDAAAIGAAFGAFGKEGCGGCHKDFRGPKPE